MNWNQNITCPHCGGKTYCYLMLLREHAPYDQPGKCEHCGEHFVVRTSIEMSVHKIFQTGSPVTAERVEG